MPQLFSFKCLILNPTKKAAGSLVAKKNLNLIGALILCANVSNEEDIERIELKNTNN
jgi:hypothetical protein